MNRVFPSGTGPPSFSWSLLCSCSSSPTAGPKATVSCCAGAPAPPRLQQERVLATSSTQEHHKILQSFTTPGMAVPAQFGTFWATLCHLWPQHRAKQTPNFPSSSQEELSGFSGFFFQPPYCNTCLPSPTGTQEPTTSISDFSGEISAGLLLDLLYPLLLLGFTSTHCIADVATAENDTALTVPDAQVGLLPNCSSCPPPPPNLL